MGDHPRAAGPTTGDVDQALIDASGHLLARWGVAKTTVNDLAREAGCSRATVYRIFPGGKRQIMARYALGELQGFFAEARAQAAQHDDLGQALTAVILSATRGLAEHQGFRFMLVHEPGMVLPYLGFSEIDRLYSLVSHALAPEFERFVGDRSTRLIEMATRITLSHVFQPSDHIDLTNAHDVHTIVERHLVPTVHHALAVSA